MLFDQVTFLFKKNKRHFVQFENQPYEIVSISDSISKFTKWRQGDYLAFCAGTNVVYYSKSDHLKER